MIHQTYQPNAVAVTMINKIAKGIVNGMVSAQVSDDNSTVVVRFVNPSSEATVLSVNITGASTSAAVVDDSAMAGGGQICPCASCPCMGPVAQMWTLSAALNGVNTPSKPLAVTPKLSTVRHSTLAPTKSWAVIDSDQTEVACELIDVFI